MPLSQHPRQATAQAEAKRPVQPASVGGVSVCSIALRGGGGRLPERLLASVQYPPGGMENGLGLPR
jgi:hypothetical protein